MARLGVVRNARHASRSFFLFVAAGLLEAVAAPCAGFNDVDTSSPFCANVEWLKNRGITLGCSANLYCPNDPVTRLQMAAFISRLEMSLQPTVHDSQGRLVGPLLHASGPYGGAIYVVYRKGGQSYPLTLVATKQAPGEFTYFLSGVYFEHPDCTGKAYLSFSVPYNDLARSTAVVVGGAGERLFFSSQNYSGGLGLGTPHQPMSFLSNGACDSAAPGNVTFVEVTLVANLQAQFVPPFKLY
jgi:hypothetical protein